MIYFTQYKVIDIYYVNMDKETLVENIKEWLQIENELKELRKAAKERRERKKELTSSLVDIMKVNDIDCFDVNGGKLMYSQSKVKAPINKKTLMATLHNYYKHDPSKAAELSDFILNNREIKVKETIRHKEQK